MQRVPTIYVTHHRAHAVAAVATSGFSEAAVLVVDGAGSPPQDMQAAEISAAVGATDGPETISIYHAGACDLLPMAKEFGFWLQPRPVGMPIFGSLGGMYSAVSQQIFGDSMEAGKVMGLAPYGRASIGARDFIELDGCRCLFPTLVPRRYDHDARWPDLRDEYQDLAASVQHALNDSVVSLAIAAIRLSGCKRLCYVGGVALNCTANELIIEKLGVENVYVMAAAEDSGTAIGAAYMALWTLTGTKSGRPLRRDSMGKTYPSTEIKMALNSFAGVRFHRSADPIREAAKRLIDGEFLGWFDAGSEFGPRALGHRSILADPRPFHVKDQLNSQVKHRESFRPFAPVVLLEVADDWFDTPGLASSPFMLRACRWRGHAQQLVSSVVHVDGTGRLQTITEENNPRLYRLLKEFERLTGIPVLLNTSLNLAGDPIVETPLDALWCLLASGLKVCVMEDFIIEKMAAAPDFSRLRIRRAFTRIQECRIETDIEGPVLRPGDLGLETPAALGDCPQDLLARLPSARWAAPRWAALSYSTAETETPWGRDVKVVDVIEGELLRSIPRHGVAVDCFLEKLAALPIGRRRAAVDRLWSYCANRLITIESIGGVEPSLSA